MPSQNGPEFDRQQWLDMVGELHGRTALGALGGRVVRADENQIEIELPITDATRQPFGLLHGGISLFLAESAASTHATYGVDLTQIVPVGVEINGSHLRSASEGTVRAVGRVLRRSRHFIVHEVDILHVESGELLTRARVTNYYKALQPKKDED